MLRLSDQFHHGFRISGLFLTIFFAHSAHAADPSATTGLSAYVGGSVDRLVDALGEPGLRTPNELWYWRRARISGGQRGLPSPSIRSERNGLLFNGAGGNYAPPSFTRDFCNVVITLDDKGLIETVDEQGPGCFEFIHSLRRARKENSTAP